jgi:thiamine pyrophosphokinase
MPDSAPHLELLRERYDALLVANGTPLKRGLFVTLRTRADLLVALDGGVDTLMSYSSVPDLVAGDFDSASRKALQWAKKGGARIQRLPSQDAPDIAKGLILCRDLGLRRVLVAGFSGARTDHELASMSIALRIPGIEATLITEDLVLFPLRGRVRRELHVPGDCSISWFAFPMAGPSSLTGVLWPFRNRVLKADGFHSLSNRATAPVVHLSQAAGRSILFIGLRPQVRRTGTHSE